VSVTVHSAGGHEIAPLERSFVLAEGCPVCREVADSGHRWFGWFVADAHAARGMQNALSLSAGLCPRHSRRLLREPGATEDMPGLWPLLARAGLRALEVQRPLAECPACVVEARARQRALTLVRRALADVELADHYVTVGGACLPHAHALIAAANEQERPALLASLSRRLGEQATVESLGAVDPDAIDRARLRQLLPSPDELGFGFGATTLGHARARWRIDSCSACLAAGLRERRYLEWLSEQLREDPRMLDKEPFRLCPRHLHDLHETDSPAAESALEHRASEWRGRLEAFASEPRPREPRDRLRLRRHDAAPLDVQLRALVREPTCGACTAETVATRRELELLIAASETESAKRGLADGHGLCVRHCLALEDPDDWLAGVTRARLCVLAWEADEARRKRSWSYRYEPVGPEHDVHVRVLAQLDGRTFLGGPVGELPC
jgi:hypothetical protein